MRTLFSWLFANVGTVIRIIGILILMIYCFGIAPSDDSTISTVVVLIVGAVYYVAGFAWSKASAESGGMGFIGWLVVVGAYYWFFGLSKYASHFGSWNLVGFPILCVVIALAVAIYCVVNLDDVEDVAFLVNASAVENFETGVGYFFNRFAEVSTQMLFLGAAIGVAQIFFSL